MLRSPPSDLWRKCRHLPHVLQKRARLGACHKRQEPLKPAVQLDRSFELILRPVALDSWSSSFRHSDDAGHPPCRLRNPTSDVLCPLHRDGLQIQCFYEWDLLLFSDCLPHLFVHIWCGQLFGSQVERTLPCWGVKIPHSGVEQRTWWRRKFPRRVSPLLLPSWRDRVQGTHRQVWQIRKLHLRRCYWQSSQLYQKHVCGWAWEKKVLCR